MPKHDKQVPVLAAASEADAQDEGCDVVVPPAAEDERAAGGR